MQGSVWCVGGVGGSGLKGGGVDGREGEEGFQYEYDAKESWEVLPYILAVEKKGGEAREWWGEGGMRGKPAAWKEPLCPSAQEATHEKRRLGTKDGRGNNNGCVR